MKALLIIDMQNGSFRPYSHRLDTLGTVERINLVAAAFRAKNYPVIFIQHDGTNENCYIPHTDDWELLPEIDRQPADIAVSKTANDAFYKTKLHEHLQHGQIDELFITGCATDFCVDATIKGALTRDYKITIVEDAHTTANRPFIDAETIIKHYNWLWNDMSATKHKMQIVKTNELSI